MKEAGFAALNKDRVATRQHWDQNSLLECHNRRGNPLQDPLALNHAFVRVPAEGMVEMREG